MPEDRIRVLRVLEYVGSRSFVERCLERRTVKGRYYTGITRLDGPSDYIQEAILGETAEVLTPYTEPTCECDPEQGYDVPVIATEETNG